MEIFSIYRSLRGGSAGISSGEEEDSPTGKLVLAGDDAWFRNSLWVLHVETGASGTGNDGAWRLLDTGGRRMPDGRGEDLPVGGSGFLEQYLGGAGWKLFLLFSCFVQRR